MKIDTLSKSKEDRSNTLLIDPVAVLKLWVPPDIVYAAGPVPDALNAP